MVSIQRICLSHTALALCKFTEFYDRFKTVIPTEHCDVCKALVREIADRGVVEFRNKCVGHIWDKEQNRPLVHSEIMVKLDRMTKNNFGEFLKWINDPSGNIYPRTVVSIVETVRDSLARQYSLTPNEIIAR
jgi:hypothetical protein